MILHSFPLQYHDINLPPLHYNPYLTLKEKNNKMTITVSLVKADCGSSKILYCSQKEATFCWDSQFLLHVNLYNTPYSYASTTNCQITIFSHFMWYIWIVPMWITSANETWNYKYGSVGWLLECGLCPIRVIRWFRERGIKPELVLGRGRVLRPIHCVISHPSIHFL